MKTIGDKVTIILNMKENMYDYVPELKHYRGREATILEAIEIPNEKPRYFLDIDNRAWAWYEEYFQ